MFRKKFNRRSPAADQKEEMTEILLTEQQENRADIVIATIQANKHQVIAERELARVIGCNRTVIASARERHADRFSLLNAEQSEKIQLDAKCVRLVLTLKLQADDGKKYDQICYTPTAALEICRHLRCPIADEVMDKLYELAEQKTEDIPQTITAGFLRKIADDMEAKDRLIAEQKPKAEYFEALVNRDCNTNFRDTAKELGLRPKDFTNRMLEKYCYRDQLNKIKPHAKYVKTDNNLNGFFVLKECNGRYNNYTGVQTLITPHGRDLFFRLFSTTCTPAAKTNTLLTDNDE